jgi:hypothetical protein
MAERFTLQIEPIAWDKSDGDLPTTVHASWLLTTFRGGCYWDIEVSPLMQTSHMIRDALNELAMQYSTVQSSRPHPPEDLILRKLTTLAGAGKRLYINLFSLAPEPLRNYLNSSEEVPFEIIVQVSPKLDYLNVPWGMIFNPFARSSGPSWTAEEYHDSFWCVRRHLATVYQNVDAWRTGQIKQVGSGLVSVLCKEVLDEIGETVSAWPPEDLYYEWEKFCFSNHKNQDRVLHFFCHGIEDNLFFEKELPIGPQEFKYYLWQRPKDVTEVPIFNSCKSTFVARGEWLTAVWDKGLRGFIGTEAKVPSKFAWDFGRDLTKNLLSNRVPPKSISDVMYDLRKKYRPFGLLYGLYADPDVSFPGRICTDHLP